MSNQKCFKQPRGYLVAARNYAILCGGIFAIFALPSCFAPIPVPTDNENSIATYAFQTAVVLIQQTQVASNLSVEPTIKPADTQILPPAATDTQALPPAATDAIIPVTSGDCIPNNPQQTGVVVDVVDGDTIKVLLDADGKTYSVRYIGMDTPENTSQVEFFGPEATAKNSELVYGKTVTLIKDVSETDRYGRLLRYVIADGIFVNYELVMQGYANTASYPPDIACIPTFQLVEGQASASKLGFWAVPPTVPPYVPPTVIVVPQQPSSNPSSCCKVCGPNSQPCGDSCISLSYTCHKGPGCACK